MSVWSGGACIESTKVHSESAASPRQDNPAFLWYRLFSQKRALALGESSAP